MMPVAGRLDGAAVRRDLVESDLELARLAVAELAGAAKVVDPGLDWAVAVDWAAAVDVRLLPRKNTSMISVRSTTRPRKLTVHRNPLHRCQNPVTFC